MNQMSILSDTSITAEKMFGLQELENCSTKIKVEITVLKDSLHFRRNINVQGFVC